MEPDAIHDRANPGVRAPTQDERILISRLLAADFAGAAELRRQLAGMLVESIDENGSLRLHAEGGSPADIASRIPVEATYSDRDDVETHVLLHVVNGFLNELEIYRDDSQPVLTPATLILELQVEPPW